MASVWLKYDQRLCRMRGSIRFFTSAEYPGNRCFPIFHPHHLSGSSLQYLFKFRSFLPIGGSINIEITK